MQKPFKKVLSGNIILIIFFEIAYSNVKLKKKDYYPMINILH